MEDKFTVTVPSRYFASPIANSLAVSRPFSSFFGPAVSGTQAFANNLMQFMLGAPIVDYNSISVTLGGNPSATAKLEVVETSVTRAECGYSSIRQYCIGLFNVPPIAFSRIEARAIGLWP